ncbi:restriction endonuclease subunit S [Dermabacter hominis]|uniref:restriction endonuclease subunit S n=1 Tax=Dermabacter hominis TaxID=36740 RepID=UPI0021A2E597|nr:restriction endonuclease subunit S [Dermabacter hominis]MCT1716062.1 restriction endonuclease subunit S [Dermabacter hominis]
MSVWKEYSLGEVCRRLSSGKNITARDIHDVGQYVVFGGNGVRGYTTKSNFVGECAVIGRQGAYCGNVRYFHGEAWMSEHAVVAEAKPEHDSRFLACLLSTMNLGSLSGQAAQPGLSVKVLAEQKVVLPDGPTQRLVSEVVGSFDDHIENNRRRIEVLEEMARAIYREWFVKFRYPGHEDVSMVDSALGLIPEGWELVPASTLVTVNPRIKLDKSVEHPFITMGDLDEGSLSCRPSDARAGGSGSKFELGDTLFARITPCLQNGKTGLVQSLAEGEVGMGSTEFIVLRGQLVGSAYTYCLARDERFRGHAISSMSGASGRQRVRNECFDSYLIAAPPGRLSDEFEATAEPLLLQVKVLFDESERLGALRDALLPKLVTGEIDVSSLALDTVVAEQVA